MSLPSIPSEPEVQMRESSEESVCDRCEAPMPEGEGTKAGPRNGPWEWLCDECLDAAIADAEERD